MTSRIDYRQFSQAALQAMLALEQYLAGCGFDHKFMHLLKLRASQINGCAYCIDMHSRDLLKGGASVEKVMLVSAWREAGDIFPAKEKAALHRHFHLPPPSYGGGGPQGRRGKATEMIHESR